MAISLDLVLETIPEYARDVKMNLSAALNSNESLTMKQRSLIVLSVAVAIGKRDVLEAASEFSASSLTEVEMNAAKGAAVVTSMNDMYYRFVHTCRNEIYGVMPSGLRMNIIGNSGGIDKIDFLLCSLAVSVLNGCSLSIDSHEKTLSGYDVSAEQIQSTVKIAAIMYGFSKIVP